MAISTIGGALVVAGDLTVLTGHSVSVPTGQFGDAEMKTGDPVGVTKTIHLHKVGTNFDLAIGGTVATREEIVYVCSYLSGATIRKFHVKLNGAHTVNSCAFNIKKNGTSVLSGGTDITYNVASGTGVVDGTVTTTTLAQDDVVSIELDNTASGDGTGPFAWVEISENAEV